MGHGAGLHPFFVNTLTPTEAKIKVESLKEYLFSYHNNTVVLGECGLDFVRAASPAAKALQVEVFRAQVELARELDLPMSIHCVKAHGPLLELLRERETPPSIMHAYSGSAEVARALVDMGHCISFAANICIANARKVIDAARAVPSDRLLIETDSPDQTPPARRPAENEPAFIRDVAERLAELRDVPLDELARTTFSNACRLLGLDEAALLLEPSRPGDSDPRPANE